MDSQIYGRPQMAAFRCTNSNSSCNEELLDCESLKVFFDLVGREMDSTRSTMFPRFAAIVLCLSLLIKITNNLCQGCVQNSYCYRGFVQYYSRKV